MASNENPTDREARVAQLLHQAAATERAPDHLRARISADADARDRAARTRRRRLPQLAPRGFRLAAFSAFPLVAAAVVLVVLVFGSSSAAPSLNQATHLAVLPAVAPAPAVDVNAPKALLTAKVGDLHFPNWRRDGNFRATGARSTQLAGRSATTVYYSNGARQVAYSILASPAITRTGSASDDYRVLHRDGRTFVVWTVSNHTCLLSGQNISAAKLWQLARSTTQFT